ncbi:MAG: hypothetical protein IPJ69_13410 [Deltaproteobacteria bacterium]|nr:MAG: hypothetical protein IPJ69_13410 [Deltaproteobacteria bacterium]
MKRFIGLLLISIFSLVIQGNLKYLPTPFLRIDLLLLTVFYLGFFVPFFSGIFWIIVMALIQEAWSVPFHGPLLFTYLIFFFFLRSFHKNLFFQEDASQVLWVFVLSFVSRWMIQGILLVFDYSGQVNFLQTILFSVFQGVASIAFFPLLNWLIKESDDPYAY